MIKYKYGPLALMQYDLQEPDSIYIPSITVAKRKPTQPSEPEEL
jgi:hypothetical protein